MQCSKCKKDSVIFRKYEGRALCRKHFLESVDKTVRKTIRLKGLLPRGSNVACAVSGNASSMLLLYELHKLNKMRQDLKISAIIFDEGVGEFRKENISSLRKYTKELAIPLYVVACKDIFGMSLDEAASRMKSEETKFEKENENMAKNKNKKNSHEICSCCRTMRSVALNRKALEIGADRIAIARDMDDEIQAITAEYFGYDASLDLSSILKNKPAKYESASIPVIKPVSEIPSGETELFAEIKGIKTKNLQCPCEQSSFRYRINGILGRLEAKHSGIKFNILRMHQKTEAAFKLLHEKTKRTRDGKNTTSK